jgi:hypothetical protein
MASSSSLPSWGHRLEELVCGCSFALLLSHGWWMSGWQPREVVFVRRGGLLGNHHGWWPYEVGPRLVMAWVAMPCRLCGGMVGSVDTS